MSCPVRGVCKRKLWDTRHDAVTSAYLDLSFRIFLLCLHPRSVLSRVSAGHLYTHMICKEVSRCSTCVRFERCCFRIVHWCDAAVLHGKCSAAPSAVLSEGVRAHSLPHLACQSASQAASHSLNQSINQPISRVTWEDTCRSQVLSMDLLLLLQLVAQGLGLTTLIQRSSLCASAGAQSAVSPKCTCNCINLQSSVP